MFDFFCFCFYGAKKRTPYSIDKTPDAVCVLFDFLLQVLRIF